MLGVNWYLTQKNADNLYIMGVMTYKDYAAVWVIYACQEMVLAVDNAVQDAWRVVVGSASGKALGGCLWLALSVRTCPWVAEWMDGTSRSSREVASWQGPARSDATRVYPVDA